jgi:Fur family iron response transcriptional regulator
MIDTVAPHNEKLQKAGLRPTRQRLALAALIFAQPCRHVTAEQLEQEAHQTGLKISLATIYNNLHQFQAAGLLQEVVIEPGRSYFDTDTSHHHHFFDSATGKITDIPGDHIALSKLPLPPVGAEIERVDVVIRIRPYSNSSAG